MVTIVTVRCSPSAGRTGARRCGQRSGNQAVLGCRWMGTGDVSAAPAAAASERSESSRSERGWGPASA